MGRLVLAFVGVVMLVVGAVVQRTGRPGAPRGTARTVRNGEDELFMQFDEQGHLVVAAECRVIDDKSTVHGTRRRFFDDGTLKREETFVEGRRHGPTRTYDAEGRLVDEREYAGNLPVGLERRFYPDGTVALVRRYEDGVEACPPLVRAPDDPPFDADEIACFATEPVVRR